VEEAARRRTRKQHQTAKRICERLRAEHEFTGSYVIVKDYEVVEWQRTPRRFGNT